MKSIAVLGSSGGVGTTSLVYHLAWMYTRLDYNVVVADLDPQADLTGMFLDDEALEALWADDRDDGTIYAALRPLLDGTGDVTMPRVTEPVPGIGLVAGDILLAGAEDALSRPWSEGLDGKPERAGQAESHPGRGHRGARLDRGVALAADPSEVGESLLREPPLKPLLAERVDESTGHASICNAYLTG